MKHITAIVFARCSSARLPGKVLFTVAGDTLLGIVINKLKTVGDIDIVVATSSDKTDDPIATWCNQNNVGVFRGALHDVSTRTVACLTEHPCEGFLRINADSPFLQPDLILNAIGKFSGNSHVDLVTNLIPRTFPYGIAVELVRSATFISAVPQFDALDREHITRYFYTHADKFTIESIVNDKDLSAVRLVVDTPEDWEEITRMQRKDPLIFTYNLSQLISFRNDL